MKNTKLQFSIKGLLSVLLMAALMYGVGAGSGSALVGSIGAALCIAIPVLKPYIGFLNINMPGVQLNGLSKEVWSSRIVDNLFKNNEFLLKSENDSENVNYLTVHIPNSGTPPTVVKNRAKATGARVEPTQRTDQEVTYSIGEFTTSPLLITDAEEKELSYDKMDSAMREMQLVLNERVAEDILISWAPTGTALLVDGVTTNANILRTTGITNNDEGDVRASLAYTAGATGNRLNFTLSDIRRVKKFMGKQNIPADGRHMLLSEDAADQLINDLILSKYRQDAYNVFDVKEGKISRLMGFDVHVRSSTLTYTNAATPVVKAYGAAGAASDNEAMLFWYEGYVSRAIGDTTVYYNEGSAADYGDIFSALVRCGGGKRRKTEVGVVALVQTAAA